MTPPRRDPRPPFLLHRYPRRSILRAAAAAGLLATFAPRPAVVAQEATPVGLPLATPIASPRAGTGAAPARFAYVGSYTREAPGGGGTAPPHGISVFAVDPTTGALSPVQSVPSDNPSFLALDPSQRVLYAINEIADFDGRETGSVEAFAIDPATGQLALLNRQDAGGAIPAHLAVDPSGRFLVVANYVGANVTLLPIRADGSLDPVVDTVQQTGAGPNPERQEAPHPHAVTFDPAGRHVALADLGTDQLRLFRLDLDAGRLLPTSEASVAPGAGPRHLAFHPDGRSLYVINELDATVSVFAYDAANGRIGAELQTIPTVPADFVGRKSTAEIVVHPSGRFVYGSNRGFPDATSPLADSIVAYAVDPATGQLTLIGHATDGIDFPRNFALDPTATWLYACNQQGDTIVQFLIDQTTGQLAPTGQSTPTPTPACLVFKIT